MSLDAMLQGNRIVKSVGLLVLLGVFLLWWQLFGNPEASVGVREVGGVVTEVYEKAYVVRLDSGQRVRVFRTVQVEAGARVQLKVTKYVSGKESFVLPETEEQ